ncbi:MAG: ATP-grasp domain-containing protein, partial [Ruminococcus sp.]|nr:ATP-grasp domain-containing protein [Ruminococcus sp.]
VVVDNVDVKKICSDVTETLKLDGNIGFDVRENEEGKPVIMECNPRITAGIPVFFYAGVNLPYLCVKKMLDEDLPEVDIKYGTIVRRRWMEMSC